MKRLLAAALVAVSALLALPATGQTTEPIDVVLFYGQGCPHCANTESYLDQLQKTDYPEIVRHDYEVYNDPNNAALMKQYADTYEAEIQGVPMVFIGREVIYGYEPEMIKGAIDQCRQASCRLLPIQKSDPPIPDNQQPQTAPTGQPTAQPTAAPIAAPVAVIDPETGLADIEGYQEALDRAAAEQAAAKKANSLPAGLTLSAVIGAAIVDAINPCAFAVLILLMTTVLATGHRRRALLAGLSFALSIFISYLLMGLGLFSAIQAAGVSRLFYIIIGILAILIGLFNLKDYFWYGKWFIMEVPLKWRPKMKSLIRGATSVPGAFLIGFAVSLFLLPCTSGPYIVILGLLSATATKSVAMALLVLYNAIFILPMLIITLVVAGGLTTTEKAEAWRQKRLRHLHLIAGVIILALGIIMLSQIGLNSL